MSIRDDDYTNTEADAAAHEALRGQAEAFGDGPGDQSPSPFSQGSLGPDPWEPWICTGCGDLAPDGQPEVCKVCGLRNFGT